MAWANAPGSSTCLRSTICTNVAMATIKPLYIGRHARQGCKLLEGDTPSVVPNGVIPHAIDRLTEQLDGANCCGLDKAASGSMVFPPLLEDALSPFCRQLG